MNYFTLNDGTRMPANGFGTFQIPNTFRSARLVTDAINMGYRLIDTAEIYHNESMVGKGIKDSNVPRDQLFITSKLWLNHAGYRATKEAIDNTLTRLNLSYLDLYLIHQPFGDCYGSWRAMEEAKRSGKIKSIGISNFPIHKLIDLAVFNDITPAINQIEINPWRQKNNDVKNLQNIHIQPEAWAPFAEGHHFIFHNHILKQIAKRHHKTIAQVILRWDLQRGIATLAKSTHLKRIQENLNIYDFHLTFQEMNDIAKLNYNYGSVERLCGNLNSNDPRYIKKYTAMVKMLSFQNKK